MGVNFKNSQGTGVVKADGFQTSDGVEAPKVVLSGTVAIDPPALTTGAFAEGDLPLPGVSLGDKVDLYPPYDVQGIIFQASPSAANTITVSWSSCSLSTIDLASGTWGYTVTRRL